MDEKVTKPVVVPQAPTPVEKTETPTPDVEAKSTVEDDKLTAADWELLNTNYLTSPVFYEIANYFGIEQGEYANSKDKLSDIVDYVVNSKKSAKIEDILVGIRELEDTIQPPAWGEKRYANVYRYVRLAGKRLALNQAMSAFEKKEKNG